MNAQILSPTSIDSLFVTLPSFSTLAESLPVSLFPKLPSLPQLPICFTHVEQFIHESRSWETDHLTMDKLSGIEPKIDQILCMLSVQKHYANNYWQISSRRVEASLAHLFTIWKQFIMAVLPEECSNLAEAKKQSTLCISLIRLNGLVNQIYPLLESFHSYLGKEDFREEATLVEEYMHEFIHLCKHMPTLKREQLNKTSRLLEYINIVNPIELQEPTIVDVPPLIKGRASTIQRISFSFLEIARKQSIYTRTKQTQSPSRNESKSRSPSNEVGIMKSNTLAAPQRKFTTQTRTHREASFKSLRGLKSKKKAIYEQSEKEPERIIKKRTVAVAVGQNRRFDSSNKIYVESGNPSSKWDIVRLYVKERIAARKIRAVLAADD